MKTRRQLGLAALLSCATLFQWCGVAVGQVTMQFPTIKDVGISGYNDILNGSPYSNQMNHSGGSGGRIRALKGTQNAALLDFDTDAMALFLAENPGTASWTLNVQVADNIDNGSLSGPNFADDVQVLTIESTNDWAESDGSATDVNFNWDQTTAAATYFYAQTRYTGPTGTLAGGVSAGTSLDTANSLEWIDPDSGSYVMTTGTPNYDMFGVPTTVGGGDETTANLPTPEFTNSVAYTAQQLWESWGFGHYATLPLDNAIANAMMNDVNNRGLRFGPLTNAITSNWRIYEKEQGGGTFAPYLEVTITPSVGIDGDFDEDGDVDGNDFLVWQRDQNVGSLSDWQNNYGMSNLTAAVGSVPEPSSLLLISAASLLVLGRRRV